MKRESRVLLSAPSPFLGDLVFFLIRSSANVLLIGAFGLNGGSNGEIDQTEELGSLMCVSWKQLSVCVVR